MKKTDKFGLFFLITLLPYSYILYRGFDAAINGIWFHFIMDTTQIFGLSAFVYGMIETTIELVIFPILPICMIYQFVYLIYFCVRLTKKKASNIPLGVAAFITVALVAFLFGGRGISEYKEARDKERFVQKVAQNIYMLAEDADVIIEDYSSPVRITGGIAGTEFVRNTILIDYDTKKVTFLFAREFITVESENMYYKEFLLTENNKIDSKNIHYTKELDEPGKTLTVFYLEEHKRKTVAIELCMEDGSVYSINNILDEGGQLGYFLHFSWSGV